MKKVIAAVVIAALIAAVLAAIDHSTPAPAGAESENSGTARMVTRLADIADGVDPLKNAFLNPQRAAALQQRADATEDPAARMQLIGQVAREHLLAGRTRDALAGFVSFRDFLDERGFRRKTKAYRTVRELIGVCYLRIAEEENCVAQHCAESCLFPIRGGGVHTEKGGARAAFDHYRKLLDDYPNDTAYRWLHNLAAMTLGIFPDGVEESLRLPEELLQSDSSQRFVNAAQDLGVAVSGLSGGVCLDDFDGDGFLDIVASSWGLRDQLQFLRNNGDGTFSNRTREAGLEGIVGGLNICHADYDNDGDLDILVLRGAWLDIAGAHPNSLLQNDGKGKFRDVTEEAGLLSFHPTQAAAWGDYDDDGFLDLFIGNESTPTNSHPCELYHNNGDGTFTDVARTVGLGVSGYVKGVAWGDYDDDGRLDLYLSVYGSRNGLFRNEGPAGESWRFTDVTKEARVGHPRSSFPTWFFDYDNDGRLDIVAAPLRGFIGSSLRDLTKSWLGGEAKRGDRIHLYHNGGDGTFTERGEETGLGVSTLSMGSNFGDIDNDGFLDCYFGTGEPNLATLIPNLMLRNDSGERFANVTYSGGFGHLQKGHGVAFGDIDNDGDQDIYAVMGGAFHGDSYPNVLFENPGNDNRWITLILEGVRCNRSAVGARIEVIVETAAGARSVHVTVGTGGSFGSSSLQQEIGLGAAQSIRECRIRWPGDPKPQVIRDLPLDRHVKIRQGGEPEIVERKSF